MITCGIGQYLSILDDMGLISLGDPWLSGPDMEKGADTQTLSAEIFENCGHFWIVEEYSPSYSEQTLHIVEIFN